MICLSCVLVVSVDVVMFILGGEFKCKEMILVCLGDVLSYLYMGLVVLKKYEDEGCY